MNRVQYTTINDDKNDMTCLSTFASVLTLLTWAITLILVSIEVFKENYNNDYLWPAWISLLATLFIPIDLYYIKKWADNPREAWCCGNHWRQNAGWYLSTLSFLFISSTLVTLTSLAASLARSNITGLKDQYTQIEYASVSYLGSALAGHYMKSKKTKLISADYIHGILAIKIVFISVSLVIAFVTGTTNKDDTRKYILEPDIWALDVLKAMIIIYLLTTIFELILNSYNTSYDILEKGRKFLSLGSSAIALFYSTYLVGLYNDKTYMNNISDKDDRQTGLYNAILILILVSLVCDHGKKILNM